MFNPDAPRCGCCGVSASLQKLSSKGICGLCHMCDGTHHNHRTIAIAKLVKNGQWSTWQGIAACCIEDAWMCGKTKITDDGTIIVLEASARWEVLLAWIRCTGEQVQLESYVQTVILPWYGTRNTLANREAIRDEINRAMRAVFEVYRGCDVFAEGVDVTSGGLTVNLKMDENEMPTETKVLAPDVEIPDDVFSRKRAEA